MTAQLSRERSEIIKQTANHILSREDTSEHSENLKAVAELALLALAGMESEPVGYYRKDSDGFYLSSATIQREGTVPLYTAPPAPVAVPDELTREEYKRRFMEEDNFDDTYRGGWNACRAAMLKAEPVMPAAVADQTAAKEKLLELLQRGIDFQSAEIPVNATSAPMQPLEFDDRGTLRFKENKIVRRLLDYSKQRGYGLNEIALEDFTDDDRMQLAQLIGYSLSGYGELSYVSDESWERAAAATPEKEE